MRSPHPWLSDLLAGLLAYLLTSIPVWIGISFGINFLRLPPHLVDSPRPNFLDACSRADGLHYKDIVEKGYSYDPRRPSSVAFFPAYPVTARLGVLLTGCDARLALFVTSNLMLLGTFVVFSAYLRSRLSQEDSRNRLLVLALFGLWPAGLFFRMTYSESTFLLFTLLVLYGMMIHWPLPALVLLAGLATAARPVGLAVSCALTWHILSDTSRGPVRRRAILACACAPLTCWGLLAYMLYQGYAFGAPFAFAQTQSHWTNPGLLGGDLGDKLTCLMIAEPIWGVYTPDPARNWRRFEHHDHILFSLYFWNPILFVVALGLVVVGAIKSWLTGPEVVLGLGLLAIPYLTRAYEISMDSHARFAAIVIPAYLVLGRVLRSQPAWVDWAITGLLAVLLMTWSSLFAANYPFF